MIEDTDDVEPEQDIDLAVAQSRDPEVGDLMGLAASTC